MPANYAAPNSASELGFSTEFGLDRRATLILVLFGASLLLTGLGTGRVLTFHEAVFAEPAKEMLSSGDFVVPKIGGVPFTDKPPATAWLIAASMTLFHSQSEWVVRFPSAFAAIASALIIAQLAARWFGRPYGLVAGLMQLTMLHVLMQARLAEADTLLLAGVSTAMAVFGLSQVDAPGGRLTGRWLPWLFYAAVAWCVLAKGLIGPAFIFGGCGAWLLVNRDWRGLRFFASPIGILLVLGSVLPWIVLVNVRCPAMFDTLVLHHFGRFQGHFGTHAARFSYFYLVPMLILPWTPFAGLGLWRLLRTGEYRDRRWIFLACWFVPGMALLSWSSFKAKHYTIPLLPPLTVLAAVGFLDYLRHRYSLGRGPRILPLLVLIAACVAGAVGVELGHVKATHAIATLIGLMGVGMLAMFYFECRQLITWQVGALFATAWLVAVGEQLYVMPAYDSYRAQAQLAERINQVVPPKQSIYMLYLPDSQITYYLQPQVVRLDADAEFDAWTTASSHDPMFVLAPLRVAEKLARTGEAREIARCSQINSFMTERDRLVFLSFKRSETARRTSASEPEKLQ